MSSLVKPSHSTCRFKIENEIQFHRGAEFSQGIPRWHAVVDKFGLRPDFVWFILLRIGLFQNIDRAWGNIAFILALKKEGFIGGAF